MLLFVGFSSSFVVFSVYSYLSQLTFVTNFNYLDILGGSYARPGSLSLVVLCLSVKRGLNCMFI